MLVDHLLEQNLNKEDPRTAQTLKHSLIQGYQSLQGETDRVQAENTILHAQEDCNQAIAAKKVPQVALGD